MLPRHNTKWTLTVFCLFIFGVIALTSFVPGQAAPLASVLAQNSPDRVSGDVLQALGSTDLVPVIVSFADPASLQAPSDVRSAQVAQARGQVLGQVTPVDFHPYQQYSHIPAVAGLASEDAIAALLADPQVTYIQIDQRTEAHLGQSVPALGADIVHNTLNVTGAGVRVAVLDTGINTSHPDLSGSLIAQHCFTEGATFGDAIGDCPTGDTLESANAQDENGHGSNVSGIITANGSVVGPGFAPDAQIIAVRVLAANGSGWVSDWIAGLNWLIANHATLQTDVVNMSLGTNALYPGNCDSQQPTSANAIAQLRNKGVVIFASSGNQGSSSSLASPSCNTGVIAVGATYDSSLGRRPTSGTYNSNFGGNWPACFDATSSLQTITCFTNSNSQLDMVAPGAPITSAYVGTNGISTFTGTSQASPTAAGIAALMLQVVPGLTPDQIETTLKSTGTLTTDPRNGLQFPLINALSAVQSLTPGIPTIINPNPPATTNAQPVLTWSAAPNATGYVVQLDGNNPPLTTVYIGPATSFKPATLLPAGTYYWRVKATNASGESDWSNLGTVVINSAVNAAPIANYLVGDTPTFTWFVLSWATRYEVQFGNISTFAGATIYPAGSGLSFTLPTSLTDGTYYWRVRGCASALATSCGAWSAAQSLQINVP